MKRRDFIKWNALAGAGAALPSALGFIDTHKLMQLVQPPKAKSIVVLYMVGGPSQIDLFDYKPELVKHHGKTIQECVPNVRPEIRQSPIIKPLRGFKQYGECGQWVSDFFPNIATVVDDLAFIKSLTAHEDNHTQAQLEFCTGVSFPGNPYAGAWLNYALKRPQGELPQSFLLTDPKGPIRIGDFAFKDHPLPVANSTFKFSRRERTLDILKSANTDKDFLNIFTQLNKIDVAHPDQEKLLQKRLEGFRNIYSMREPIMDILNLDGISSAEEKLYGLDDPICKSFGEQLIMARRLAEKEVPFIKVFCGNDNEMCQWDNHININDIVGMAHKVDRPIAGFIKDMKQRGLLETTTILWAGEFGRRPVVDILIPKATGRSHNLYAGTLWLAGAGIKKGISYGETDELSWKAVSGRIEIGDIWATLFHLMGVDHQRVSHPSTNGVEMRLTRSYHRVLHEILA